MLFKPSLIKYSEAVENFKRSFSNNRDVFKKWSLVFITFIMSIFKPEEMYLYLVEQRFLFKDGIKCGVCGFCDCIGVFTNNDMADNVWYVCKRSVLNPSTKRYSVMGKGVFDRTLGFLHLHLKWL